MVCLFCGRNVLHPDSAADFANCQSLFLSLLCFVADTVDYPLPLTALSCCLRTFPKLKKRISRKHDRVDILAGDQPLSRMSHWPVSDVALRPRRLHILPVASQTNILPVWVSAHLRLLRLRDRDRAVMPRRALRRYSFHYLAQALTSETGVLWPCEVGR